MSDERCNWTPAPWVVRTRKDGSTYISLGDPVNGPHEQFDLGREASANLMGAALELYEVLDAAIILLRNRDQNQREAAVISAGMYALAKARGET